MTYPELAEHLFELEGESMMNNVHNHFLFNGWLEKYGEDSVKFAIDLVPSEEVKRELAEAIKADFESGYWSHEDGTYHYMMMTIYGGLLTKGHEQHLASLTRVGTQLTLDELLTPDGYKLSMNWNND